MNVKRFTEGLTLDLPVVRGKVGLVEVTGEDRRWGSLRFCITRKDLGIAGQCCESNWPGD